jgi:hypothetical protein
MSEIGEQFLARLRSALPGATVYWEREPAENGLHGAVLSAEYQHRKFTMQFEKAADSANEGTIGETTDCSPDRSAGRSEGNASGQTSGSCQIASSIEKENEKEGSLIEQVVDDFTDFFSRTIYPKEKFTRII